MTLVVIGQKQGKVVLARTGQQEQHLTLHCCNASLPEGKKKERNGKNEHLPYRCGCLLGLLQEQLHALVGGRETERFIKLLGCRPLLISC